MKLIEYLQKWRRADRGWPRYLPGGRVRTSTVGLLVAFIALFWINQNYEPPAPTPAAPETAVVPPGFVPDPEYTWVPRTNVQERPRTTTPQTTTTTTTTPTTTEPSPTDTPTTPTSPTDEVPTTVVDPDGRGPLPPSTVTTVTPSTTPTLPTVPPLPGLFGPESGPTPTTPESPR
jgi:hypothetical protein